MHRIKVAIVALLLCYHLPVCAGIRVWPDEEAIREKLEELVNKGLSVEYIQDKVRTLEDKTYIDGNTLVSDLASSITTRFQDAVQTVENLKSVIESSVYQGTPETGGVADCCKQDDDFKSEPIDDKFKVQTDYNSYCVRISNYTTKGVEPVNSPALLERMIENKNSFESIRWQYFGNEEGITISYPSHVQQPHSCATHNYDNRNRDWYTDAVSPNPKDVFIAIETTIGSPKYQWIKDEIKNLIKRLNPEDRIAVIYFSSSPIPNRDEDACYKDQLAFVTSKTEQYMHKFIDKEINEDNQRANYFEALKTGLQYFNNSRLSLSDNKTRDELLLIFGALEPTFTWGSAIADVIDEQTHHLFSIYTFYVKDQSTEDAETKKLLKHIGTHGSHNGNYLELTSQDNVTFSIEGLFREKIATERSNRVGFIGPYFDHYNIGTVTSVCKTAYKTSTSTERAGVVCVDLLMDDIIGDINAVIVGDLSYAFLIDSRSRTLAHPLFPKLYSTNDSASIDIRVLEKCPEDATDKIISSMIGLSENSSTVSSIRTRRLGATAKHGYQKEVVKATYYWKPILVSRMSVCVVITEKDYSATITSEDPDTHPPFIYHNLSLNDEMKDAVDFCLNEQAVAYKNVSSVYLSWRAFKHQLTGRSETDVLSTLLGGVDKLRNSEIFKDNVVELVRVTSELDSQWSLSSAYYEDYITLKYISFSNGLNRVYPGFDFGTAQFDPMLRPWYITAVGHADDIILTTEYDDITNKGKTISIAKAITLDRIANVSMQKVLGVIGADLRPDYLSFLMEEYECTQEHAEHKCFLLDKSGFILYPHSAGLSHISTQEPYITNKLVNKQIMQYSGCVDGKRYQILHTWQITLPDGRYSELDDEVIFDMIAIPHTNLIVGIKHKKMQKSTTTDVCETDVCTNEVSLCGQPHYAEYDDASRIYMFCRNHYNLSGCTNMDLSACPPESRILPYIGSKTDDYNSSDLQPCRTINCTLHDSKMQCDHFADTCCWNENEGKCSPKCSDSNNRSGIIAIGILVPLCVISIGLVVIIIARKRIKKKNREETSNILMSAGSQAGSPTPTMGTTAGTETHQKNAVILTVGGTGNKNPQDTIEHEEQHYQEYDNHGMFYLSTIQVHAQDGDSETATSTSEQPPPVPASVPRRRGDVGGSRGDCWPEEGVDHMVRELC